MAMQISTRIAVNSLELGQRIRRARERIGMSQEALASALDRDQKAVSEYETGKRKVSAVTLKELAAIVGLPITYFFENDVEVNEFDPLDHLLLQEFHSLPTPEDKEAALQFIRIFSISLKRHS